MANFYSPTKNKSTDAAKSSLVGKRVTVTITHLDHLAQGVSGDHKPLIFVEGVLPGEIAEVQITEQRGKVCIAKLIKIVQASDSRQKPFCEHINVCGGCQTQHSETQAMLQFKQQAIENLVLHTSFDSTQIVNSQKSSQQKSNTLLKRRLTKASRGGKSAAHRTIADKQAQIDWQPLLISSTKGYRRKTRLSVDARKPEALKMGFRSKGSNKIFNLNQCPVLNTELEQLIKPLQQTFAKLQTPANIGHISLLNADNGVQVCIRIIQDLSSHDSELLTHFAGEFDLQLILEGKNHELEFLSQSDKALVYKINEKVSLQIHNDDFIQVNSDVNQKMVKQAAQWLQLEPTDSVLDLFCGIGNFSLPLARNCKRVTGIEGVAKMVQRAQDNATSNQLDNCHFIHSDLNNTKLSEHYQLSECNKVLLDPAREGAQAVIKQLAPLRPSHIVYVSCNPATFARDAALLIEKNYRLDKVSLLDMFPQTAHTELMALFVPLNKRK